MATIGWPSMRWVRMEVEKRLKANSSQAAPRQSYRLPRRSSRNDLAARPAREEKPRQNSNETHFLVVSLDLFHILQNQGRLAKLVRT